MASGVTLPTFDEKEKLLHQKLNAMVQAISARFLAGVSTADLTWPLVAEGNLNMSVYNIINGKKIWDIVNAAQYDTLEDAASAAGANGVVLVPPNTTVVTQTGATLNGATAIIGTGPSSIVQIATGSGATFALASTSGSGGWMCANLTIDGNNVSGANGIALTSRSDVFISNVRVINCDAAGIKTNTGCGTVLLSNISFDNGGAEDIYATTATKLLMSNISSEGADGIGIRIDATGTMRIAAENVHVNNYGTIGLQVTGSGASFVGSNVFIDSAGSGHGMVFGAAGTLLNHLSLQGGEIVGAGANGIDVHAASGKIDAVNIGAATATGIDLNASEGVNVVDCDINNAADGIDGSGCGALCTAHGNKFSTIAGDAIIGGANFNHYDNEGVPGASGPVGEGLATVVSGAYPMTGAVKSTTIPANSLRPGDILHVEMGWHTNIATGDNSGDYVEVQLNGQSILRATGQSVSDGNSTGGGSVKLVVQTSTTGVTLGWVCQLEASVGTFSCNLITGLDFTSDQTLVVYNTMDDAATSGTDTLRYFSWRIERQETM